MNESELSVLFDQILIETETLIEGKSQKRLNRRRMRRAKIARKANFLTAIFRECPEDDELARLARIHLNWSSDRRKWERSGNRPRQKTWKYEPEPVEQVEPLDILGLEDDYNYTIEQTALQEQIEREDREYWDSLFSELS